MTSFSVYKTTSLVSTGFYYGIHKTSRPNDSYLGSGTIIKLAVKKYGPKQFKKEVLFCFATRKEAADKERELIAAAKGNPLCWNITPGGEEGWDQVNESGVVQRYWRANRETMREAIREAVKRKWADPDHRASHLAVNNSPEVKEKQREGHRRQWKSLSAVKLQAVKQERKARFADEDYKNRKVADLMKYARNPDRKPERTQNARLVNHTRWHVNRSIVKEDCGLCLPKRAMS